MVGNGSLTPKTWPEVMHEIIEVAAWWSARWARQGLFLVGCGFGLAVAIAWITAVGVCR